MYSVSAAYLAALALPVHKYRLTGTVGTEAFDEANIVSGSLSVSNKVSEGSEIKLGSVYTGELKGKFTGMSIARGAWVGKTITLSEGLLIDADNDTYEDVPLGIFTVAEANHTAEGVEVTAYDSMTNFDKTRNDLTDTGTAYEFLTLMCQKCGVTLGSTLADIQALPNGTETFTIYTENDIETWRDLLSWIAQTLGAVATIGRDGKLYLRQYSMTAAATIDETHRFTGCCFSDFVTYYTGMSVVNIALRQTEYKSEVVDDGLTYNLGSNPLVQGHYEYVQEIIDDFSNVALTPFNAQMLGGAIYDLCDCLTFSGGIAAGAVCGVMGYTWKYNGAYSVKGFGANPALATAKSKTQKELEALYNTVGQEINEMSVVQNSTAVTIGENTETSILKYNFEVTQEENTTMVDVSVVMTSSASETEADDVYTLSDIVAALTFYVDNSQVTVYDPTFIVDEGKDTMTFNYSLSGLSVGAHEFDIRLEMGGGSGSVAVGDVHEMLWGYGITFEVYAKSIEVTELPLKTTFFAGQRLDYTGAQISLVYNNGLKDDVTSQSTFDPVAGTVLTADDVGTLTVDVNYDTFYTDFDLTVELLGFDCNVSSVVLPTFGNSTTETIFIADGSNIYVANSYTKSNTSENYAKVIYASLDIDNAGNVTILDSDTIQKDFSNGSMNTRVINGFARIGTKYYIPGSSSYIIDGTFFEIKYVDISDGSSGNMTITYNYLADADAEVYSFGLNEGDPIVVGNYIWMPGVRGAIRKNGTLTTYASTAWIAINGTNATVYILDPSIYSRDYYYIDVFLGTETTRRGYFNQSCYFKYDNGSMNVYDMTCDSYGLHCPLKSTFSTGFTNEPNRKRVSNSNKYVLYQIASNSPLTIKVGLYDYDTDTYNGEWTLSQNDDYDIFNMIFSASGGFESVCWSEDKEMFFYPISSAYETTQTVYASGDFETWIYATCASEQYDIENSASLSYEDGIVTIGQTADSPGIYDFSPATLTYKVD